MHEWLAAELVPEARVTLAALDDSPTTHDAAEDHSQRAIDAARRRVAEGWFVVRLGLAIGGVAAAIWGGSALFAQSPDDLTPVVMWVTTIAVVAVATGTAAILRRRGAGVVARVVCVVEREHRLAYAGLDRHDRFLVRMEDRSGRQRRRRVPVEFFETAHPGTFFIVYEHAGAIVHHRRLGAMSDPVT